MKNKDCLAETPRLYLRRLGMDDLSMMHKLLSDPLVMKYSLKGLYSREETKKLIESMLANEKKTGFGGCSVICKETGRRIGFIGLWQTEEEDGLLTDLGYRFFSKYWNKGYATESIKAALAYIKQKLPATPIIALIDLRNQASIMVAKKAGMCFVENKIYRRINVAVYQL